MRHSSWQSVLLEALFASLIFVGLLGFSTYMVYHKSINALEQEIKIGLLSNVRSAASTLSGDLHQRITGQTSPDDPVYQQLAAEMERMREASQDVRYIYTTVLDGDTVRFVVNPSPQNDNDGDGLPDPAPALMQVYDNAPPELVTALREHQTGVSVEPYRDQWGTFISAYAPFYDRQGRFSGILAMDLELSSFYQRLEAINRVFSKANVTIAFLGLMVGLMVCWLRRSSQQVRQQLASREQDYQSLQQATEPLQLRRVYDWPLPLLFLRGGAYPRLMEALPSDDASPGGATRDVRQASLRDWWLSQTLSLRPCAASELVVNLNDATEACFAPEHLHAFWQRSFLLWRQLARQPLTIVVGVKDEDLMHWVLDIRLTLTCEPEALSDDDRDWWNRFLRWQGEAAAEQVVIREVARGQLCLDWRVPKFEEAL
ncbi:PDC sensor domain-containing protein [Musicola paradisiaca]|uniref:Signal transduction histidine kinase regulating citrate/malate metabolism n=1 Tax=Musicola paradisiaca (strain Ech703) TaxID=579405 RepID=C6C825_MUSP7|nr:hypothetical protein [Musicola paradisiaca]ACS84170.1 signal transduction histidine kinase regulating citrate/malate metabolism [Musicola paradisiaca Ech703]